MIEKKGSGLDIPFFIDIILKKANPLKSGDAKPRV
jgi:hypothetical protein